MSKPLVNLKKDKIERFCKKHHIAYLALFGSVLYRNNLKNRDFDKEAPQNSCLERATIALGQGASEDKHFEGKPTQSKTDSSGCFGISPFISKTAARCCDCF